MKPFATSLLTAAILVSLLAGGCQHKFTRQRYETIHIGMGDTQVRQILGEPHATDGRAWSYVNDLPYHKATIVFEDGRVADKSWSNDRPRAGQGY